MSNAGVHNPNTIDLVAHHPQSDIVSLVMIEEREWDGSEQRLLELEEKIQNYFSFFVDGQFREMYPHLVGKPVEMKLYCTNYPDAGICRFIEHVRTKLAEYKIDFTISQFK